jgi:murein DD-endopeptidase MepM/ murein hydrolase activator NlpD
MRISAVAFFMILTTMFLSACGKNQMADITDRGSNFYGRYGVTTLSSAMNSIGSSVSSYVSNETVAATETATIGIAANDLPPSTSASSYTSAPLSTPFKTTNAQWQWPVKGRLTERFGSQGNGTGSEGIVIAAAEGTPIHAAQFGTVAFVGQDTKNYGNIVILRHTGGTMTAYSHARNIVVSKGQQVTGGSVIGYVGQSGSAREPQLHFAVREGSSTVDPMAKLPQNVAMN